MTKQTRRVGAASDLDRRPGLPTMSELVSVIEAAQRIGVTRQAVLQRIESGSVRYPEGLDRAHQRVRRRLLPWVADRVRQ